MTISAVCTVNGGASTSVTTVAASSTVTIALADAAGVDVWTLTCISTDELNVAATITSSLVVATPTSKTFAAPSTNGAAMLFRSTVTGSNGATATSQFLVDVLTSTSLHVAAINETTERSPTYGWISLVNELARAAGGSGAPTNAQYLTLSTNGTLTQERVLTPDGTSISGSDGGAGGNYALTVTTNGISDAKLRQGTACTVIGRSANSTGNVADIAIGTNGHVLMRTADAVTSGLVATANITDANVTMAKIVDGAACTVVGRSANSTGVHADISIGTNDHVLMRTSDVVTSGFIGTQNISDAAVTKAKLGNATACSVIGRSANSDGVPADITIGTNDFVLMRTSNAITSGLVANANISGVSNSKITWDSTASITLGTAGYLRWSATKYVAAYDSGNDYLFIGSSANTPTNSPLYTYVQATERVLVRFTTAGGVFQVIPGALSQTAFTISDGQILLGADNAPNVQIRTKADRDIQFELGTVAVGILSGSSSVDQMQWKIPTLGNTAALATSMYGVHGAKSTAIADANYTIVAGDLIAKFLELTGTLTAGRNVLFPTPASEIESYQLTLLNNTGQTLSLFRANGTGATINVANAATKFFWVRPGGVYVGD